MIWSNITQMHMNGAQYHSDAHERDPISVRKSCSKRSSGPSILDIDLEPIPSLGPSLKIDLDPSKNGRSRADPGPILGSDPSLTGTYK